MSSRYYQNVIIIYCSIVSIVIIFVFVIVVNIFAIVAVLFIVAVIIVSIAGSTLYSVVQVQVLLGYVWQQCHRTVQRGILPHKRQCHQFRC